MLETLAIFGIHADYMAQFRDFLEEEGLPTNDERIEFMLPVIKNLGTQKLKTIRLKKMINGVSTEFGDAFRQLGPVPTLAPPDPSTTKATYYLQQNQVVLNWYPKIQALKSGGVVGAIRRPRRTRRTSRLGTSPSSTWIGCILSWSVQGGARLVQPELDAGRPPPAGRSELVPLLIPAEELAFDSFEKVRLWEEIALSLLKKYTERYYTFRKRDWELPHLEYRDLMATIPISSASKETPRRCYYRILIEVPGRDHREARGAEGADRGGRPEAVGIPRHQGHLVWSAPLPAAAVHGGEDRRDQPGASE